jgi:putative ABC transport system permease protein
MAWWRWRRDSELDEEIDAHLDLDTRSHMDRGLAPDAARSAALRRFGSRATVKERARESDPLFAIEMFLRDIALGARSLARQPAFAIAAVISLALGIGANTLIFSLLDSTLLKPMALADPDRLAAIWTVPVSNPSQAGSSSVSMYFELRDRNRSFESMGAFNGAACGTRTIGIDENGGAAERIRGVTISPSLLHTLGVAPLLGRTFIDAEDPIEAQANVIILSYRMWQRRFGGDPDIVGKALLLDHARTEIVGVMPAGFDFFGDTYEYFAPLCMTRGQADSKAGAITIVGRLTPGVSLAQAQSDLSAIVAGLAASQPEKHGGLGVRVESLQRAHARPIDGNGQPSQDYGSPLVILQGAVAFVLLIACANVAGLLLARTASRHQEVGLRFALGASRWRIIRQLVTESLPLAAIGGLVGVLLSWAGLRTFTAIAPPDFPGLDHLALNLRVLGFTAATVITTSILFAIVPAVQASHVTLVDPLKSGGRGTVGHQQRFRRYLVTGQIAMALVLLVGAGLLINSFVRVLGHDLGADISNVLTFDYRLPQAETMKTIGRYRGFGLWGVSLVPAARVEQLIDRLPSVPGVVSVAAVSVTPFGATTQSMPFFVEGREATPSSATSAIAPQVTDYFAVTRGYFKTMRIPLRRGRDFDARDDAERPLVMIVNDALARQAFGNDNPVGRRITLDFLPDEKPREIIGVVGDTSTSAMQGGHQPAVYVPHIQQGPISVGPFTHMRRGMVFVVRTSGPPLSVVEAIKRAVADVDRTTPVASIRTIDQTLDSQVQYLRLYMLLLAAFGGVAAVLAATGIYGVMAYSVAERTREIGIRVALGAQARDVLAMILAQAGWIVGVGLAVGVAAALAFTRAIQSALVDVKATDPLTYVAVSVALLIIAATACVVPTRRATAVDPTVALRSE